MYEELVKRLRYENLTVLQMIDLMDEAADAIEKLTAYVRQIEELRKDGYYLLKTETTTNSQATMTGPLPKPPKEMGP